MVGKAGSVVIHLLIATAGAVLFIYFSKPIISHTTDVLRHLNSGSWEIVSDRPYLEAVVRKKYSGDAANWVVSFPAVTGQSYALDKGSREYTINLLGRKVVGDVSSLRFHETELPPAYKQLLSEALSEAANRIGGEDRRRVEALAKYLLERQSNPRDYSQNVTRVRAALLRQPENELLAKAVQRYQDYEVSFPVGALKDFQVFTEPPYDVMQAWEANSTDLPPQGRCLGTAASMGMESSTVPADITVSPRLGEVSLVRPWMSDLLLDESLKRKQSVVARHFGESGDLGIIPARLWILFPDRVHFKGTKPEDTDKIIGWIKDNSCCKIVCETTSLELAPQSLAIDSDRRLSAVRADSVAALYAVVSRRRVPR